MRNSQKRYLTAVWIIGLYFNLLTYAQTHSTATSYLVDQIETLAKHYPSESIYLQTSKGIYETEEDVWFKAYVLNAQSFIPSVQSKTLFVQLIDDKTQHAVWEEKYEIENGFVDGHLYLQDSLQTGRYTLAAYSAGSFYRHPEAMKTVRQLKIVKRISEEKEIVEADRDSILDFRVFPEGGHLVSGIRGELAFKAVNGKGLPVSVSGTLLENDRPILEFKTEHAGMGSFVFTPDINKHYRIQLSDSLNPKTYPIPNIKPNGISMQLTENNENFLMVKLSQNSSRVAKHIYLSVQIRGEVHSLAHSQLKEQAKIKIPLKNLPQGIAEITIFNESFEPICERLVYVKAHQKLNIKTWLNQSEYQTREQGTLKIKVTDHQGNPVVAHLGLSVFDKIYENPKDPKTLLTHYYLSTQLKGYIYNPSYYFDAKNKNRKANLDLLMLTQGWRRYVWASSHIKTLSPQKQAIFETINGQVIFPKKQRKQPAETLPTLMAFAPEKEDQRGFENLILTDSTGAFTMMPMHLKQGNHVYLKLMVPEGSKYTFKANDDVFKTINALRLPKTIHYPIAPTHKTRNETPEPFKYPADIKVLDEVTLKTKKRKVYRDKYLGKLDSIANLWNRDYVAVCGALNCFVHGRKGSTKPVDGETYRVLLGKNREQLGEFYSQSTYYGETRITYKRPKYSEAFLLKKFNLIRVKGYYGKKEFYQPIYDTETLNDPFPDNRNTLLWKPDIITDTNGEATIRFSCSDINTRFVGIIEAVDNTGLLGHETFEFLVRKRGN